MYTPFDVAPGEPLNAADLDHLVQRSVAEGYFVEYKSQLPTNEKVGKSIASLANTNGGWYIVGVTTDQHNVATAIPGFPPHLCPDPQRVVREVIKTHISPPPTVHLQVVTLDTGNLVLVACVPPGQDTPFITRDGRIYRRRLDASEPIPETDRYAVDRLVDQGRQQQEDFVRFCRDERTFAQGESKRRWVRIMIQPYPRNCVDCRSKMRSIQALDAALALSKVERPFTLFTAVAPAESDGGDSVSASEHATGESSESPLTVTGRGNLPFTTGLLTPHSLVVRQTQNAHFSVNAPITAELFADGSAKLTFELFDMQPFGAQSGVEHAAVRAVLDQYQRDEQAQPANASGISLARFFDIADVWSRVVMLTTYYQAWLGDQPTLSEVKVAVLLDGVWRSVGFLDTDDWATYVQQYGLPILDRNRVVVPADLHHAETYPYDNHLWLPICGLLQFGLGVPAEFTGAAILKVAAKH